MEETEEKKKSDYNPSWLAFIGYGALALLALYYNIWSGIGAVMFGIMAALSFPHASTNKKIKEWMTNLMYLGIVVIVIAVVVWGASQLFGGIGNIGKYEGQTAEEWFNDYDDAEARYQQLHDCVEPYATAGRYISADDLYYECF